LAEDVLLVVKLGEMKFTERQDIRGDALHSRGLRAFAQFDGGLFLRFIGVEDGRHVLTFRRNGTVIVRGPVDLEDLAERGHGRVEIDLEGFGVIADLVIAGIFRLAAGVADAGTDDAGQDPKLGFRLPESAQGEGGRLDLFRSGLIDCGQRARTLLAGRFAGDAAQEERRNAKNAEGKTRHGSPNWKRSWFAFGLFIIRWTLVSSQLARSFGAIWLQQKMSRDRAMPRRPSQRVWRRASRIIPALR
jgi:hypothetical protein